MQCITLQRVSIYSSSNGSPGSQPVVHAAGSLGVHLCVPLMAAHLQEIIRCALHRACKSTKGATCASDITAPHAARQGLSQAPQLSLRCRALAGAETTLHAAGRHRAGPVLDLLHTPCPAGSGDLSCGPDDLTGAEKAAASAHSASDQGYYTGRNKSEAVERSGGGSYDGNQGEVRLCARA